MRKLKLRFVIPKEDESNVTGKFFKVFFECMKPVDNIDINDGKLNILFSFEDTPTEIIQAISELPFQNIEYLRVEDAVSKDKSSDEAEETDSHRNTDPDQIPIDSSLEGKKAAPKDVSKETETPLETQKSIQEEETSETVDSDKAEENQKPEGASTKDIPKKGVFPENPKKSMK